MQGTLGASASSKNFRCDNSGHCRLRRQPVSGMGYRLRHGVLCRSCPGCEAVRAVCGTGNRGTVLNVELYKPNSVENTTTAAIKGVAKDNKGNIYKVAF